MSGARFDSCFDLLPAGAYAAGVSGGADSVALLRLLAERTNLQVHVVHLNHETRGSESDGDAEFVVRLAKDFHLSSTIARRSDIEPSIDSLPTNLSARFRAIRQYLFAKVVCQNNLLGVIVAHHRDDQAETVLHRLLRGGSINGLAGMRPKSRIGGIQYFRPLLSISRDAIRDYLRLIGQDWREDASNQSPKYARNRLRAFLSDRKEFANKLIELSGACARLLEWSRASAPRLAERFPASRIAPLPRMVARAAVRRWLVDRGISAGKVDSRGMDKLINMATDAATPARLQIAGGVMVHRSGGWISVLAPG